MYGSEHLDATAAAFNGRPHVAVLLLITCLSLSVMSNKIYYMFARNFILSTNMAKNIHIYTYAAVTWKEKKKKKKCCKGRG